MFLLRIIIEIALLCGIYTETGLFTTIGFVIVFAWIESSNAVLVNTIRSSSTIAVDTILKILDETLREYFDKINKVNKATGVNKATKKQE